MKPLIYAVEIILDGRKISASTCQCPAGKGSKTGKGGKCSHVATMLVYMQRNFSCTDMECQWSQKKSMETVIQTVEEMVASIQLDVSAHMKDRIRKDLKCEFHPLPRFVAAKWLLEDEHEPTENFVLYQNMNLECILFSNDFQNASDQHAFLSSMLNVDEHKILEIAKATVGQKNSRTYSMLKNFRLTASNFGIVLAAVRRNSYPPSLFKRLLGGRNLDRVRAIVWGRNHEKVAFKQFTESYGAKYGYDFQNSGLYLHKSGLLGASPDGESSRYTLEIKCPFTIRDCDNLKSTLKQTIRAKRSTKTAPKKKNAALKTAKKTKEKAPKKKKTIQEKKKKPFKYFVSYDDSTHAWIIDRKHEYYHQIQGQLYFTNKEVGLFFIWTINSYELIEIEKDPEWAQNINILLEFYFQQFLPHVLHNPQADIDALQETVANFDADKEDSDFVNDDDNDE